MASIKCASCGHRILLPTNEEACANCGASLIQQLSAVQQSAEIDLLANPFESEEEPEVSPASSRGRSSRSVGLSSSDELYMPSSYEQSTEGVRSLQIYQHPGLPSSQAAREVRDLQHYQRRDVSAYQPAQESYSLQPYQSTQIAPIDPRGGLVAPFAPADAALAAPTLSPLPAGFPSRPPDVAGTIINVQSQMENPLLLDGAEFIFKLIRDLIWAVPHDPNDQHLRQVHVTTLRVRTSDGVQRDARIEGYMRGGNLSLGDTVSLWGHKRRGVLLIYRGYNHTTKSVVKTTASSSPLTVFLLLLIFLGICWLLFNFLSIHWHLLLH
jgi:hypothetical protein